MLLFLQAPQIDIPKESFALYCFGDAKDHNSIVGRAALNSLGDLRVRTLPEGDEEIRVWCGFGITLLQGVVLRKKGGTWTAIRLLSASKDIPKKDWSETYNVPKSGWLVFWRRAEALGIRSLPDDATLPQEDRKVVLDGFSFVVELQRAGRYRAYAYGNPEFQTQWPEAKRMIEIDQLLTAEFPYPKP